MKTDQLFHEFFTVAPQAVFELLQIRPPKAYTTNLRQAQGKPEGAYSYVCVPPFGAV